MAKITYENKEFLNENAQIPNINKVADTDLNEIKEVINENDDNVGDLSDLNTTNKNNLVSAINELNSKKLKKLWENSNTTSTFSPQTITLLSDNYDYLIWFYFDDVGNNYSMSRECLKGSGTVFNHSFSGSLTNVSRTIDYQNDTEFIIQECRSITTTGVTITNNRLIPFVVYGGKF